MNSKKAKALRQEIHGEFSPRNRKYVIDKKGTIRNHPDSLRAKYQKAKRRGMKNRG